MPLPSNRERSISSFLDDNDVPDPSNPTSSLSSPKVHRQRPARVSLGAGERTAAAPEIQVPRFTRRKPGRARNPSQPATGW